MVISGNIKQARLDAGLTQQQMADKLEMSRSSYAHYELYTEPAVSIINKIAKVLNVDILTLIAEKNQSARRNIHYQILIPLVTAKDADAYCRHCFDTKWLEQLKYYGLPPGVEPNGAIWRFFEVADKSILNTFNLGDFILASQVSNEDWRHLHENEVYIIVNDEKIIIRKEEAGVSEIKNIKEVWQYRRHISKNVCRKK